MIYLYISALIIWLHVQLSDTHSSFDYSLIVRRPFRDCQTFHTTRAEAMDQRGITESNFLVRGHTSEILRSKQEAGAESAMEVGTYAR